MPLGVADVRFMVADVPLVPRGFSSARAAGMLPGPLH